MSETAAEPVNPHYLNHMVALAQTHDLLATEDIVTSNGIKLLAKGARVDAGARDRLLEHKLRKPLEVCVQVADGVFSARFEPLGEALLEQHPLLHALCAPERARSAPASLAAVTLSVPMQSLLTVYAQDQEARLSHAVGVAMIALSLGRRLAPGDVERHRLLGTAGLVHDVGELYIDPAYLGKNTKLDASQWRHIVTHPLVGHRVLRDMVGAGHGVADAVLLHHERLDGFGYPRAVGGDTFTLNGEILAAAELMMALVEGDSAPLARASMAARLMPGEFSPALLDALAAAGRAAPEVALGVASLAPIEAAVPRVVRIADTLRRFGESRAWIDGHIAAAAPGLRAVLETGLQRILRVQSSFSSTGLDADNAAGVLGELAALADPGTCVEIITLVGELEWRMRELERNQRLRSSLLAAPEAAIVEELIARLKGASENERVSR